LKTFESPSSFPVKTYHPLPCFSSLMKRQPRRKIIFLIKHTEGKIWCQYD
jgi:hypothetical protein